MWPWVKVLKNIFSSLCNKTAFALRGSICGCMICAHMCTCVGMCMCPCDYMHTGMYRHVHIQVWHMHAIGNYARVLYICIHEFLYMSTHICVYSMCICLCMHVVYAYFVWYVYLYVDVWYFMCICVWYARTCIMCLSVYVCSCVCVCIYIWVCLCVHACDMCTWMCVCGVCVHFLKGRAEVESSLVPSAVHCAMLYT